MAGDRAARSGNIYRYRRRSRFNIGLLIFLIIFIYLMIFVIRYLTSDTIRIYEVQDGTMSSSSNYTGLILRDEQICSASESGYLNYYAPDGTRVSVGSLMYTIDETGRMAEMLRDLETGNDVVSNDTVHNIRGQLSAFSSSYDPTAFSNVYSLGTRINQSLGTGISEETLNTLIESSEENLNFSRHYSEQSGVVTFRTDGYEAYTPSDVTEELLDAGSYSQTVYAPGDLIESGSPVCKIITNEEWDIVIPISSEDAVALEDDSIVSITFNDTKITVNAEYSTVIGADGEVYARLHLYKYMIRYCDRRYVDITLNIPGATGLKIPTTSVVTRDLFVIPTEYLITNTTTDDEGNQRTSEVFRVQTYDDAGNMSVTDVEAGIFLERDGLYYVGTDSFNAGDVLQSADGTQTYTVSSTQPLQGVYNVNRGYAVFRLVEILAENNEYYIVSDSTPYGLSVYDHIILNATLADEDQILFN